MSDHSISLINRLEKLAQASSLKGDFHAEQTILEAIDELRITNSLRARTRTQAANIKRDFRTIMDIAMECRPHLERMRIVYLEKAERLSNQAAELIKQAENCG